jgi:hypothetical protein
MGAGNLGTLAVQNILKHPDLELIGTWVPALTLVPHQAAHGH